jgi:hypothetical protein
MSYADARLQAQRDAHLASQGTSAAPSGAAPAVGAAGQAGARAATTRS